VARPLVPVTVHGNQNVEVNAPAETLLALADPPLDTRNDPLLPQGTQKALHAPVGCRISHLPLMIRRNVEIHPQDKQLRVFLELRCHVPAVLRKILLLVAAKIVIEVLETLGTAHAANERQ